MSKHLSPVSTFTTQLAELDAEISYWLDQITACERDTDYDTALWLEMQVGAAMGQRDDLLNAL